MSIFGSSSLAFSDHNGMRENTGKSGLLKNLPTRVSKQHLVEHKMFGAKRKNIQIGKKFKGSGKGIMHGAKSAKMVGDMKSSGISPSLAEFDKMMSGLTGKSSGKKKSMFSRKSFG